MTAGEENRAGTDKPEVRLRRIHGPAGEDGIGVLAGHIWPRGLRKKTARIIV